MITKTFLYNINENKCVSLDYVKKNSSEFDFRGVRIKGSMMLLFDGDSEAQTLFFSDVLTISLYQTSVKIYVNFPGEYAPVIVDFENKNNTQSAPYKAAKFLAREFWLFISEALGDYKNQLDSENRTS